MRLNFGIFALHLMQMAMLVVVPAALVSRRPAAAEHWKVYLPAVLVSFVLMVPAIIVAEKRQAMKPVFIGAIALLLLVQLGLALLWRPACGRWRCWLLLFFVAFNMLEATLPSLDFAHRAAAREGHGAGRLQHDRSRSGCFSAARWAAGWRSITARAPVMPVLRGLGVGVARLAFARDWSRHDSGEL